MKKFVKYAMIFALSVMTVAGCGKEENTEVSATPTGMAGSINDETDKKVQELTPVVTPTPVPPATLTPEPTDVPTPVPTIDPYLGKKQSFLTGEWIDESVTEHRPYAVMLNNIKVASPQSGTSDADILYEILTEAGITRLMAIFSDIREDSKTAERLGSVRSARHYFASIADEYDAIFIHYGETTYATKKMKAIGIDHITGMYGAGVSSFYRDKSIKAPHNAFASLKGIQKAIQSAHIRTEYREGYTGHFTFYPEDTDLISADMPEDKTDTVNRINLGFSSYTTPYFVYDAQKKLYYRYQFDTAHVDYNNDEPLAFKNLIVQYVKEWNIDKNGYQTMDIEKAEGEGLYITNGKMVSIRWKKDEDEKFMRYYSDAGEELIINPGKTYIAVFPEHRIKYVTTE